MNLDERCRRIREIDKMITALMNGKDALYYDGLTCEQHNKMYSLQSVKLLKKHGQLSIKNMIVVQKEILSNMRTHG